MKAIVMVLAIALAACTAKIEGGADAPPGPPAPPPETKPTDRPASPAVQALKLSKAGESVKNTIDLRNTAAEETRSFTFSPESDSKLQLAWAGTSWFGCDTDGIKGEYEIQLMDGDKVSNAYKYGLGQSYPVLKGLQYRVQYKYTNAKSCKAYSLDFTAKYL